METKEKLQEKIFVLQKKISECKDDAAAILLQKELIDLLRASVKNKDLLVELVTQNEKNKN